MAINEIHVGDIGTVFELTVMDGAAVVNISTATTKQIILKKPDLTKSTKTATFTTDGSDGKMRYVIVADDLDQSGDWQAQGKIIMPSGTWYTDISEFTVHANL